MGEDEDEQFWVNAPRFLDDPLGWSWAWWRRVGNAVELVEFVVFLALGVAGTWRFFTRGLVTEDLYLLVGFVVLGVIMIMQTVRKRTRA